MKITNQIVQLIKNKARQALWLRLGLAMIAVAFAAVSADAQIQVAGTQFVNVDATTLSAGTITSITNSGTLSGFFVATNLFPASQNILVTNVTTGGPEAILLGGLSATNYMSLFAASDGSGGLIHPPAGLVGSNATCSIEVWAFNPAVADQETMVSWGARFTGLNMAFLYGVNANSGAAQHYGGADMTWDSQAGGGAPQSGTWHYLVYTCDGTNEYVYVDGVLANEETPVTPFSTTNNSGIALGAQWDLAGNITNVSATFATLALGRVRVDDGALTPAQIQANFNAEKATFLTTTPQFLTAPPVHRYSFNEPATNDATGLTFHDSVGGADGIVQGSEQTEVAQFSGRRLILPGGLNIPTVGYGAPYGDLPNGLLSTNSVNNGGSGELSVEIWFKNTAGKSLSWSRIFDAGSSGAGQVGNEITDVGNYQSGWSAQDDLQISAQNTASVNLHRLEWKNFDVAPSGSTTNATDIAADGTLLNTYQIDQHIAVTWKESTGKIIAYVNGWPLTSITVSNAMSALNDVNIWLGRSCNGDNGTAGEYDEVRFYNYVLSPGQVLGDFQTGPDTINTSQQAATIMVQPQSATVNQGWPANFFVEASGSPRVSYQWLRNGLPVPGANNDTYTLASVSLTNNGDAYSCVVSNFTASANTVTSSTVTLTVIPNQAPPAAVLHETRDANPSAAIRNQRDEYDGTVGCVFQVGSTGALVTHVGMYDVYGDGLSASHQVTIYTASGTPALVASNFVSGTDGYLTNGYRYVALNPPVYLAPNTSYILEADVYAADGDMWADNWAPAIWNSYFIGSNGSTTRASRFGSHGQPDSTLSTVGDAYGAPNLAAFPMGPAVIAAVQTNVTGTAGQTVTLTVGADGETPVSVQWYNSSTGALTGQTNSTLVFTNAGAPESGTYYAVASNALNTVQSPDIMLTVLDNPVAIIQQPTNTTTAEGYSATFSIGTFGSLPIFYQWYSNDVVIMDATNSTYTISVATLGYDGVQYSCVVSNFANSTSHVVLSDEATLTVLPNKASLPEMLFQPLPGPNLRDNYNGMVGCIFKVGNTPALVTHLGYYAANGSLNYPHHVGVFNGTNLIASVFFNSGGWFQTNNYFWLPLNPPVLLATNTSYVVAAEVFSSSGDPWPNTFVPSPWNSYYVGTNGSSTRTLLYGGSGWPTVPTTGNSPDDTYGAANLAVLPVDAPTITMMQTNITQYQTFSAEFDALVNGQPPVTVQWYKSPSTLLSGQTNTSLIFPNLSPTDSGNYYLVANNPVTSVQGPDVTLNVLAAVGAHITQPPQSQTVYLHQTVYFNVGVTGTPPFSIQWSFNNSPISGATNATLALNDVGPMNVGAYEVAVTNLYGGDSASANLDVITQAAGSSYSGAVIDAEPLVYYRFSDVSNGTSAFNAGILGSPANGTYHGDFAGAAGPQPPQFVGFESNNIALSLNGSNVDVTIPALNLDVNSLTGESMVAWIYSEVNPSATNTAGVFAQYANAAIIYYRSSADGGNGLSTIQDINGFDMVRYTWNNTYYTFATHLDIPTNQWVLVALSVYPDRAEIYLDDGSGMESATNVAVHTMVPFSDTTYVGNDPATTVRWFSGLIDEPMIFGYALSADQINTLYQAGTAGVATPVEINLTQSSGNIILTWPQGGTLLEATNLLGPWTTNNATPPYTNVPDAAQKFYRVQVQ